MRQGSFSDGKETTEGKGEGGRGFSRPALWVGDLGRSCLFSFLTPGGPACAGSLSLGGEVLWFVVRVLGGRGKFRELIFAGAKLLHLP